MLPMPICFCTCSRIHRSLVGMPSAVPRFEVVFRKHTLTVVLTISGLEGESWGKTSTPASSPLYGRCIHQAKGCCLQSSTSGIESPPIVSQVTVGTNYVGHWYLTHLLLDPLKAAAPSRVVFVSSASEAAPPPIDWDNIM